MKMTDAQIIGRIKITGSLVLKSPLLIGDGAGETADNCKDIHVLKNQDGAAFIPGTSICGVLREDFTNSDTLQKLFGCCDKFPNSINIEKSDSKKEEKEEWQSAIQIDDVKLLDSQIIYRDGVKIDGLTGTGEKGGKYDYEAVERGAKGDLNILINLRGSHAKENFKGAVAELLGNLQSGIRVGALTSKGFGVVEVENLDAQFYDFTRKADVVAWLTGKSAAEKINPAEKITADTENFVVDADFSFNSSVIVRNYDVSENERKANISAVTEDERKANISAVSLKSLQDFVIPGTSLKGILRHRAEYIFGRLNLDKKFLDKLMGSAEGEKIKSRLIVSESYIENKNVAEVAHSRNKIDRFTGGTLQGALFTSKPLYQKNIDAPTLHLHFEIINAKNFEAGLAILLLRDLWLGKVAVGGEKCIGRGTLKGVSAKINFKGESYELGENGKVTNGNAAELSKFAASVKNWGEI
jgi:CRISPR/Cas system CSM-associated protein Csm3 (group 7 of RAMP superfamily)